MRPPLVSVIITTHNYAHFLADAIQSALSQTADSIEVIVIDDGSTDDPATVVANFPDVCLIRQQNLGLAAARNVGWQAAHGKYVVFLDADDRLLPHAVALNLQRFAVSRDRAFVFGGYRLVDTEGRVLSIVPISECNRDTYQGFLEGNQVGMHATVMYRRECIASVGGFDETLRACEDYDLYLRMTRLYGVGSSPDYVADYRQHGGNMSLDLPLMLSSALRVLRRQARYAAGNQNWYKAYKRGIRGWQSYYIEKYVDRVRERSAQRREKGSLLSDGLRMFRLAPIEFTKTVLWASCKRVHRVIRR
jgi:glycosyltransferase involved in cell wall biosynthesis